MAEGWFKSKTAGLCSQCDAPANWYHRSEHSWKDAGLPIKTFICVFRCERHTVKPYHPEREAAKDE